MGRGGDEEDIRKKKNSDILWHFISFYTLSVSLAPALSSSSTTGLTIGTPGTPHGGF